MFRRDPMHTGVAPSTSHGILTPTLKWSNPVGIDIAWESTIANLGANIDGTPPPPSRAVVYAEDGVVTIADGGDGAVMWQLDADALDGDLFDRMLVAPAIADLDLNGRANIVFATNDGTVSIYEPQIYYDGNEYTYNASNSTRLWQYETASPLRDANPVVADIGGSPAPEVVIGAGGVVYALDVAARSELWQYDPPGSVVSTPAIYRFGSYNRTVVVSAGESSIYLNVLDHRGVSVWSTSVPLSTTAIPAQTITLLPSPVIAPLDGNSQNGPEIVLLTPFEENDGVISVFNPIDKTLLWRDTTIVGQFDATPAVGDIDGDGDNDIVAVAWDNPVSNPIDVVANVYAFDGASGDRHWSQTLDTTASTPMAERAIASPLLVDLDPGSQQRGTGRSAGLEVIVAVTPRLFALNGTDGAQLWEFQLENRRLWSSPSAADIDLDGYLDIVIAGAAISHNIIDLTLTTDDITLMEETVTEGESVTVSAIIHNEGQGTAEEVGVRFSDDSTAFASVEIETIEGYSTAEAIATWTPKEGGTHTLAVEVDYEDTIEETSELNNIATRVVEVRTLYAELSIDAIHFVRGDGVEVDGETKHLIAEQTSTIRARVNNSGEKPVRDVFIAFYDGAELIGGYQQIAELPAHSIRNAAIQWVGSEGEHTIRAYIDPDDFVNETNENDNEKQRTTTLKSPYCNESSYTIAGVVYESDAATLATNIHVQVTNVRTSNSSGTSTDEHGYFRVDLEDLPGGFMEGDPVRVQAQDGYDEAEKELLVYSEDGGASFTLVLHEVPTYTFALQIPQYSATADPGSSTVYPFTINNTGNRPFNLTLEAVLGPGADPDAGWSAILFVDAIALAPNASAETTLTVYTPADAMAGAKGRVSVHLEGDPGNNSRTVEFITTVNPYEAVELTLADRIVTLNPYENRTVTVTGTVKNTGNIAGSFNLSVEALPLGWSGEVEPARVSLDPRDSEPIRAVVLAPSGVTEDVAFFVRARSRAADPLSSVRVSVSVLLPELGIDALSITPATASTTLPAVGDHIRLTAVISNSALVTVDNTWVEFSYGQSKMPVLLGSIAPGKRKNVTTDRFQLEVKAEHRFAVRFQAFTDTDPGNNNQQLNYTTLPDIVTRSVAYDVDNPRVGDRVNIIVTIANHGRAPIRGRIKIDVWDGDPASTSALLIDSTELEDLEHGEERSVEFEWSLEDVTAGEHAIYAVAQPGDIQEESDTNNKAHATIIVVEDVGADTEDDAVNLRSLAIGSLIIVIIIAIFYLFIYRRKSTEDAGEEEEETERKRSSRGAKKPKKPKRTPTQKPPRERAKPSPPKAKGKAKPKPKPKSGPKSEPEPKASRVNRGAGEEDETETEPGLISLETLAGVGQVDEEAEEEGVEVEVEVERKTATEDALEVEPLEVTPIESGSEGTNEAPADKKNAEKEPRGVEVERAAQGVDRVANRKEPGADEDAAERTGKTAAADDQRTIGVKPRRKQRVRRKKRRVPKKERS